MAIKAPPKKEIISWALWDWGTSSYSVIVTTFVFAVYITSEEFGPTASKNLGFVLALAGVLIALLSPIIGQLADKMNRPALFLKLNTLITAGLTFLLFFVKPGQQYLWFGLILFGVSSIFFELGVVNYNTLLNRVSTKENVGKISGLGQGLGYIGGIMVLLIVYFGFIKPEVGLFGITDANGVDVRTSMLFCGCWILLFLIPTFLFLREPSSKAKVSFNPLKAYGDLFRSMKKVWQE
jgi:UMF1 family MFS transporter